MNNAMTYSVYKTLSGLYVPEEICELYNVGDETNKKTIKEIACYKVSEKDLNTISETARREGDQLIADIVTIFDLQLVLSFTVYKDINHDNKLYVSSNTCNKYGIKSNEKRIIKNQTYYNVTEDDITQIELKTKTEKIAYKRKYIEIALEDVIKPAEYLFICYVDFKTKKYYIKRDMYELLLKNELEVEGEPRIIYGKNCYSITENQLKEAEKRINYRKVEQLLRPAIETNILMNDKNRNVDFPKIENLQNVIERAKEFAREIKRKRNIEIRNSYNQKIKDVMDTIVIEDDDPTNDVDQYKEQLKKIMDSIVVENNNDVINQYNEKVKNIMDSIVIEDDDPTDDVDQYKEQLKKAMDETVYNEDSDEYNERIKKIMDSIIIEDDVDQYKEQLKRIMDSIVIEDDPEEDYKERVKKIMDSIIIEDNDPTDDVEQYKEQLKKIMDTIEIQDDIYDYSEKLMDIMNSIVIEDDDPTDDVEEYKERVKKIMDSIVIEDDSEISKYNKEVQKIMDSIIIEDDVDEYKEKVQKIMETIVIEEDPKEKVIIYKDKKTGRLYEPTTDNTVETITIMHKQCTEITAEELNTMSDKKIITVSVYPVEKKEYDIIICNNNGQLFISKRILEELGFYIDNPHRISVNKEIYEEINEEDLELIKSKESDSCQINIIMKQITPKRG